MASFAVAASMMAGGIYFMEASFAAKGFYAMAVLRDLLLILGDGDGDRTAGRGDRIGAVAYLLAQNDQRVAVGHLLRGFVGVTPHERKKLFQHSCFSSMNVVHDCSIPSFERRSTEKMNIVHKLQMDKVKDDKTGRQTRGSQGQADPGRPSAYSQSSGLQGLRARDITADAGCAFGAIYKPSPTLTSSSSMSIP